MSGTLLGRRVKLRQVPALGFQFTRGGHRFVVVEKMERDGYGGPARWICQMPNVAAGAEGSRLCLTALEIFSSNLGHFIVQGGIPFDASSGDHRICSRCGAGGWLDKPGKLLFTCAGPKRENLPSPRGLTQREPLTDGELMTLAADAITPGAPDGLNESLRVSLIARAVRRRQEEHAGELHRVLTAVWEFWAGGDVPAELEASITAVLRRVRVGK